MVEIILLDEGKIRPEADFWQFHIFVEITTDLIF